MFVGKSPVNNKVLNRHTVNSSTDDSCQLAALITQRRSVMFSAASVCLCVCLFVCQHDNFQTNKHRMIKLGARCIVQKSRSSSNLGS